MIESLFVGSSFEDPRNFLMNQGIKAPKKMVVTKTINKTVLFITCTALSYYGVACYGAYTVKISAKATDPLMVPAVDTIAI